MISFFLALSSFLYWTVIGRAVLALSSKSLGILRSWLLAPGIGFATLFICVAVLNQAGLPIKTFALYLSLALLIGAWGVLKTYRIYIPLKALLPFGAVLCFALLWSSWPMLRYGFNWLSYVNDDFTNYCLAAERFKDFGFYRLPTQLELAGTDYAQYYWFMHAIQLMRFGSEHAVAWMSSLTGKPSLEVFMPIIMAFALSQIFAASALVLTKGKYRSHAFWTALLLSFSPMFIFGSLYQLIAQVSGVCLLLCLTVLLTAPPKTRRRITIAQHAIATSIVGAALCIFYPEVTPFAALAVGLFVSIKWVKTRVLPGAEIILIEYSLVGILLILRHNAISYLYTLANQFVGGTRLVDLSLSLFPFFLIPSGLASIFGLQAMNQDLANPWGSLVILLGFIFLLVCMSYAFRQTLRGSIVGCLLFVELAVAMLLYRSGNDFGLYKVVMFMQPLLMAALAWTLISFKKRYLVPVLAASLFALTCSTSLIYTRGSIGAGEGMTGEVSLASQLIAHRPKSPDVGKTWVSDIDNVSAAKLVAVYYRATAISFICRDYFYPVFLPHSDWPYVKYYPNWNQFDKAVAYMTKRMKTDFVIKPLFGTSFTDVKEPKIPDGYLSQVSELSLFNKINSPTTDSHSLFVLNNYSSVKNHLAFIHSQKGNQYYLGDRRHISYFQQENDYFGNHTYFNGIGQFMLLRVENPTPSLYLRIQATKALMGSGHTRWSSSATISGVDSLPLGAVGSGAINLIVGPIKPVYLEGKAFVAIDFNQIPISLPTHRTWLKALYNSNINLDYRRLVGFGRDISALSSEEYESLDRPRGVVSFPKDIVNAKGLEYSGIYEDGWLSADSHFVLAAAEAKDHIRIKGFIPDLPEIADSLVLKISVNNAFTYSVNAKPGKFDWALPVPDKTAVTKLDIHFSAEALLPHSDARPVAAHLSYIGLESKDIFEYDFTQGDKARPISNHVGYDGWANPSCAITIPVSDTTKQLVFNLEYPGWPGVQKHAKLSLKDDLNHVSDFILNAGLNEIVVPVNYAQHQVTLKLESNQKFTLPAPDSRECAFRIISIRPR